MQKFTREYNAHFIEDLGNWLSVPEHTQFLIIDEISVGNKMEFSKLKQLTSGNVLRFSSNMKTLGSSFTPRPDVQLITIGNMSPFDVYGTWNSKLQRRMMCRDHLDQLEDRFTIVRLDGSVGEDKLRMMTPTDWSPDEYDQEMRCVIGDVCPGEINTPFEANKIVNKLNKCAQILKERYGHEEEQLSGHFLIELKRLFLKHKSFFTTFVNYALDTYLKLVLKCKRDAMAASLLDELDIGRNELFPSYPLNEDHIDRFLGEIAKEYKRTLMMSEPTSSYICEKILLNTSLEVSAKFKNSLLYRDDDDDDSDERPTKRQRV